MDLNQIYTPMVVLAWYDKSSIGVLLCIEVCDSCSSLFWNLFRRKSFGLPCRMALEVFFFADTVDNR
ncbi:hypothetical protein JHK85_030903 [Glycine max]|uniref:Uncharacterized protein n=1 Tax=Glycine max TaxID=3847 RepID=K7LNF1_SOYBN|nr:hypothetical protein JHK85_030903 [Glycine max]